MTALALPIGKLTILVGAGLVGSVLANEGRVPTVADLFSGAYKVIFSLTQDDPSKSSRPKSNNDDLLRQIEHMRKVLNENHPTIIVTSNNSSGSKKYALIVVAVGCGYVWWKGWKISDMMLATRRGLKDACASVAKQLDDVFSSVTATKKELSAELECLERKVDECTDNIAATRDEVSELRGDAELIGINFQQFKSQIRDLESKIERIEEKQNYTNFGVEKLVEFASGLENGRIAEAIERDASRPALEIPKVKSLPSTSSSEQPSPSTSNGLKQASSTPSSSSKTTASTSGLKDLGGMFDDVIGPSSVSSPEVSTSNVSNLTEESPTIGKSTPSFSSRVVGRTFSRFDFVPRSRSQVQPTTSGTVTPKPPVAGLSNFL